MYTIEINVYCLIFFSVQPLEPRQNAILSVFTNASQACNCLLKCFVWSYATLGDIYDVIHSL